MTCTLLSQCAARLLVVCRVHVYNVEDALLCSLPYHATPQFVRWLQVLQLDGTRWAFLSDVRAQGATPTREALTVVLSRDNAMLTTLCDAALASASGTIKGTSGVAAAFYALMCSEAIGRMTRVPASVMPPILAYVQAGLGSGASAEHRAGALLLSAQLATRAQLSPAVVEALLDGMAKIAQPPLEASALKCMLQLMRTHAIAVLSRRAVTFLVKTPALSAVLGQLSSTTKVDALLGPLLAGLVALLGQHHTYANAICSLVSDVRMRPHAAVVTRQLLQLISDGREVNMETRARVMTVLQVLQKHYPEEMRSVLDFELLAVHGATDNPITTIIRDAFGSTAVQPLSVSDVAITLSSGLEHTNPRLREAAVKQLRELLATNTDAVSHLANVIKCRAADSDPAVAAATLALPGLIDLIADDAALHAAVTATLASCTAALRSGSGSHAHENAASRALSVLLQLGERRPSFAGSVARALLDLLVDDEAVKGLAATARRVACTVNHPVFANDDACSSNDLLTQQHAALRSVGRRLAADDRACNWVTSDWSSLTSYGQHTVLLALLCALTDAGVDSRSRPALVAWRILRHVPAESDGLDSILCWHDGLPPATHLQTHATAAAAAEASVSVIQQLWPQIARHLPADMADSSSPDVGSLGQLFGRLCRYPDGKAMTALLERASAVFGSTHMFLALLAAADPGHLDDTVQVAALGKLADHQWPAEVAPLIMVALMHPRRRVRQAAVDALAARNRHSGADISPQLTSWVQSHREALTTGGASLQLLQGALKDGAFAGMTPHILSSLVSLQSKYAMTQLARLLVADMNSGTATAFASVWARIAVSCGSDADVALSQILLDGIAGVAGVDQSSREVLVHALESISLRPALHTAALNAVSETLYASCSETEQRRILQATISLSRRSSQSECSAAARSLLNRISFDATAVGELLGSLLGFGRQASVQPTPAKRTRGRAATAATGTGQNILVAGAMSSAVDMDLLEAVLEMLQWRSVARVEMLATPLFRVLAALLDAPIDVPQSLEARVDTDGDDSPAEDAASALSAAHGYRLTLTLSTLTNVVRAATDCAVDVQLIVRALQQASDANVRKAALQLLTAAAESMPSQVVNDALIVVQSLTSVEFVSVDDAQTARALHDAFAAIAPCWVQAHSDNGAQLLRLVVDTLHAVPRHRHAALLSALLHALPAPHALAETLWMLLAVNDRGEQSVGSTLCSSRPRVECLRAWHAMLTRANVQSNVAPTVVTVADFICNELKMTGLQSWFAHHADDVDVRSSYAEFIAAVLTKLELVKKNPSVDGVDGRKSLDAVLAALQTLAAGPMQYVLALTHLFTHEDRHVQRKALLQASRCIRGSAEEVAPDEAKEAAALHGLLLPLVLGGDSTHTAAQLGALEFLEALIVRYGVHEQFAESAVAALQTAVLCAKRESRLSIRAAALSCVASSVAALGTRVVPALPEVMSTVLDVLESTDTTTPDGIKVSSAALAVIAGLVLKLENFISPVLARVQRLLLSQLLCGTDVPAELRQAAGDIRTSLAARVPVRLLLEPLLASWDTALASGWEACVAVLRQVKLLVERMDSVQTAAYCETLFGACCVACCGLIIVLRSD